MAEAMRNRKGTQTSEFKLATITAGATGVLGVLVAMDWITIADKQAMLESLTLAISGIVGMYALARGWAKSRSE